MHTAVDMLGYLLALKITVANDGGQARTATLAEQVQEVTGSSVALSYVNQGYTGTAALEAAEQHSIRLQVVKQLAAKRGFVLLPRRWVVESSFAWAARFCRLARDYDLPATTLRGLHLLTFPSLTLCTLAKT